MIQAISGRWPRSHRDYRTTDWWLIHSEFDAISSPAYSKQADMEADTQSEAVYVFSETPGSDRPYANVLGQHTTKLCSREVCYTGAAPP